MKAMRLRITLALIALICAPLIPFSSMNRSQAVKAAGAPVSPDWGAQTIDSGFGNDDTGLRPSIAISPLSGNPYVSYYDATAGALRLATYQGSGGNCNGGQIYGPPIGWNCSTLAAGGQSGYESSIAFEQSLTGHFAIAYTDPYYAALYISQYDDNSVFKFADVITDQDGPGDGGIDTVRFPSLIFSGYAPKLAYYYFARGDYDDLYLTNVMYNGNTPFKYTEYAKRSDSMPLTLGYYISLDQNYNNGNVRMAYRGATNDQLKLASYAGDVQSFGCLIETDYVDAKKGWHCSVVDPTPKTGNYISHHAPDSASDTTRIAYYDDTNKKLKYARHTGNPSDSCGNGGSTGWICQVIDTVAAGKDASSLGVSLVVEDGKPLIAYADKDDQANSIVKVARYVGTGGNCGWGVLTNEWQCDVVDDGNDTNHVGRDLDLAVDTNGRAAIAYYDATAKALKVAREKLPSSPTFTKSYTPSGIPLHGTSTLQYTIQNPASNLMTGLAFTDGFLPSTQAIVPGTLVGTCGGTVQILNGNHGIKLTGGTLVGGASCQITAKVTGDTAGSHVDTTTELSSNELSNAPAASATLTVKLDVPPTFTKSYMPSTILKGATTTLALAIKNNLNIPLTGLDLDDTLLAQMVGSKTVTNTCGGTINIGSIGSGLSLTGGTLAAGATCQTTAQVSALAQGTFVDATSPLSSNEAVDAPSASATLEVVAPAKQSQTINFAPLPVKTMGDLPFALSATASSGLKVTFSASGQCAVNGNMVTLSGQAGSCTITAHQAGNAVYYPAPDVVHSFAIVDPAKQSQTISFAPLPDRTVDDPPFTLSATASSGLPVTFSASGQCAVSENTATLNGQPGSCTITASQSGNAQYNLAPDIAHTFQVGAKASASTTLFLPLISK